MNRRFLVVTVLGAQLLAGCEDTTAPPAFVAGPGEYTPTLDIHGFVHTMSSGEVAWLIARGVSESRATCGSLRVGSTGPCQLSWSITSMTFRPHVALLQVQLIEGGSLIKTASSRITPPGLQPLAAFIGNVARLTHALEKSEAGAVAATLPSSAPS